MSIAEEAVKRFAELGRVLKEFNQVVSLIDGNFDLKIAETKNLEMKIEKLREEFDANQQRANGILSSASDDASRMIKEATRLMSEAQAEKMAGKELMESAIVKMNEANVASKIAQDRQREVDNNYRAIEERKKKIEESLRI